MNNGTRAGAYALNPITIEIDQQGELLKCKHVLPYHIRQQLKPPPGRGTIKEFSDASRQRCLELHARLSKEKIARMRNKPLFITLTYEKNQTDVKAAKRDLDAFIKRIRRMSDKACGTWRQEFQERGAIHFHLMIFNVGFLPVQSTDDQTGWQEHWNQVTGQTAKNSLDLEVIRSLNGVMFYVSKYMSKVADDDVLMGLSVPHISPRTKSIGRQWGCFGRQHMPFAEQTKITATVSIGTLIYWHSKARHPYHTWWRGFTIFSRWSAAFVKILQFAQQANAAADAVAAAWHNQAVRWRIDYVNSQRSLQRGHWTAVDYQLLGL